MDLSKELGAVGRDLLAPMRDIGDYIRTQRTAAQISLRALADRAGVSNPYLSQIERGLRRPSAAILAQIADGLSISAESLLVRAGILRPIETAPVVEAIRADPHLTERQKASLVEIYRAFLYESRQGGDAPTPGEDGSGPAAERSDAAASSPARAPSPDRAAADQSR